MTAANARQEATEEPARIVVPVYLLVALTVALLSACTPSPSVLPTTTPIVVEVTPEQAADEAVVHALDQEQGIIRADDPWSLVNQAEHAPADQVASYLLPAIYGFIDGGQLATAQTLIEQLASKPMSVAQQQALQLHRAQLAQALGQHATAIATLEELDRSPGLSAQLRARLLQLKAGSQSALRRNSDAVLTLIERDYLLQEAERTENQVQIIQFIRTLDPLSLSLLRESRADGSIDGWIALSEVLEPASGTTDTPELRQWRSLFPGHPADENKIGQAGAGGLLTEYRHIALLLPLTSTFGKAAQAFYDGFVAAHGLDTSLSRPALSLHDIGEDPLLARFYYQAAINEGADFIIGPLGRQAAGSLLSASTPELPTLMIASVPHDRSAEHLFGISLSPEHEAWQVAEKAIRDGHRQAGVLRSDSQWGQRVADAFVARWQALGGTIVANTSFPHDVPDYSTIIQNLLGLDKSIVRERLLSARLNTNLEFTPRRRQDIDFLFMAANSGQARLLVPQLRFFQAHDLPLYGTSYVYGGGPDPVNDADLDGLVFGDMQWILQRAHLPQPEPVAENGSDEMAQSGNALLQKPQQQLLPGDDGFESPYHHTELDRLYALGLDSYQLVPRLTALRSSQWERFKGLAMEVSVGHDGNAVRHPRWARFEKGIAVELPVTGDPLPATAQ